MKLWQKILVTVMACTMLFSLSGCMLLSDSQHATIAVPPLSAGESDYQKKLNEVISILDQYYIDGYDKTNLGDYLASAAVAASGDRWSYYMTAEEFADKQNEDNNSYVGIGVTVTQAENGYLISDVTPNGSAQEAGIQINDIIVSVEGQDALEMGLSAMKTLIRGEEGTMVNLTVLRGSERIDFMIERKLVKIEVVTYEMLADGTGYIKIVQFSNDVASLTISAIEALKAQGATGLVFDLRFNPGGFKNELVKLLDYLLPEGALFRSVDYTGKEMVDTSNADCLKMPMAVLINHDSYSAAEFFAAALQEYEWATIVGTKTTGKANFQNTFELSDGSAIAVSVGHYQTPKGVTLEGIGVTPDVIVEVDEETYYDIYYDRLEAEKDAQLQAAIASLK